jgi:hypothetical protein
MKFFSLLLGIVFLILFAGCGAPDSGGETQAILPDPEINVVTQPSANTPSPVIPTPEQLAPELPQADPMAFGLESHQANFQDHASLIGEPGLTVMRHNGLLWLEVEGIEGQLDWSAVSELDNILSRASASGLSTILLVRGTPEWAQLFPGTSCGPIQPGKLQQFADFMYAAVSRYSQPPYNVKSWELWNEPDVDPLLVPPTSVFGCWGNYQDPFYGGGYYAEMLEVVYPAIKRADPEAQVLLGGLLLDCDPNQPPEDKDCSSGNFLEGILQNGGGEYFDIVSFHGYTPYFGPETVLPYALYMDQHSPTWEHLGGIVDGKMSFIRQVMAKYQVDKPIFHTEGALMCAEYNVIDCEEPDELFFEAQAEYAVRRYLRNWANNVGATIWYQFEGPGWRFSGLLDEDQNPRPVYHALQFMTGMLFETGFIEEIVEFPGLQGYKFASPGKQIWVLWSPEQVDTPLTLPSEVSAVYDKYGNEIMPDGNDLVVNNAIYLVVSP